MKVTRSPLVNWHFEIALNVVSTRRGPINEVVPDTVYCPRVQGCVQRGMDHREKHKDSEHPDSEKKPNQNSRKVKHTHSFKISSRSVLKRQAKHRQRNGGNQQIKSELLSDTALGVKVRRSN